MRLEVKAIDDKTDKTKYYNFDFCNVENVESVMQQITRHMKRELKFIDLYSRIEFQRAALESSRISYEVLFLSPDAAEWLHHKYGWLCGNEKGKIATYLGFKVMVVPDLDQDFYIGVTNV